MNADIQPALERIKELEGEVEFQKDRADAAEERYRDDLEAAWQLVRERDLPGVFRVSSFPDLMETVLRYTVDLKETDG